MITDGLNPLTALLFVGAVLAGAALVVLYVIARITKREPFARLSMVLKPSSADATSTLSERLSFAGISVFSKNEIWPSSESSSCPPSTMPVGVEPG